MKILFVSDIHLNLRKDKEWETNRYNKLIDFIVNYKSDKVVLGGDIFDLPNPTFDEIALFYASIDKIRQSGKEIILISGNHEVISKGVSVFDELPQVGFTYYKSTLEPIKVGRYNLYFISHTNLKDIRQIEPIKGFNILFSHIRLDYMMVKGEFPVSQLKKFDKVILGDIHNEYYPTENISYCGSPYSIHFNNQYTTGVFELFLGKEYEQKFIKTDFLPQKIKINCGVEELKDILKILSPINKYKIFVDGDETKLLDVKAPSNVDIIYTGITLTEDIDQSVQLVKNNTIDVIEALQQTISGLDNLNVDVKDRCGILIKQFLKEKND